MSVPFGRPSVNLTATNGQLKISGHGPVKVSTHGQVNAGVSAESNSTPLRTQPPRKPGSSLCQVRVGTFSCSYS